MHVYIILFLVAIIVAILCFQSVVYTISQNINYNSLCPNRTEEKGKGLEKDIVIHTIQTPTTQEPVRDLRDIDPIRNYDYRKLYDPLEEPTRRVDRYSIPPVYMKRMIDIPSRGYPDNYSQIGVLLKKHDDGKSDENKILRLFGRQEYPGSSGYQYYTALNSGLDSIKIPVRIRRGRELYDKDKVFIREVNQEYEVSLHKYDEPKYYPDLL
jgi:hypothetical protein